MGRLEPPTLESLSPAQRQVHDAIVEGPRKAIVGPLGIWLHSPGLAGPAQELGVFCRYESSLPSRLSELAILVVAAHWRSQYEWWAHVRFAREAGLDDAVIDAVGAGAAPALSEPKDQQTYAVVREVLRTGRLSDSSYTSALTTLGQTPLIDLVALIGYYSMVAFTLNAFSVSIPEGETTPFS